MDPAVPINHAAAALAAAVRGEKNSNVRLDTSGTASPHGTGNCQMLPPASTRTSL